jgi:hypothetical protein
MSDSRGHLLPFQPLTVRPKTSTEVPHFYAFAVLLTLIQIKRPFLILIDAPLSPSAAAAAAVGRPTVADQRHPGMARPIERLAGDIFVTVQHQLGGERRMPADLDRQMAGIGFLPLM